MRTRAFAFRFLFVPLFLAVLDATTSAIRAQGTAFTYQGYLTAAGTAANGSYDFQVAVYNAVTNGTLLAGPLINSAIPVTNGVFTVTLDFGAGVFTGSNCWLDIAVRTNGGGAFTSLSPRQALTSVPYSVRALSSAGADTVAANSVSATNIAPGQVIKSINGMTDNIRITSGPNVSIFSNSTTMLINLSANVPQLNAPGQNWNTSGTNIFGSIVASNVNTYNVPIQIYTNWAAKTGSAPMIQFGTLDNPAMAIMSLSPGHGGLGDGSEVTFQFNQLALVGDPTYGYGGRIQLGTHGGLQPWAITLLDVGAASPASPVMVNGGMLTWKYSWWNGSTELRPEIVQRVSAANLTTGNGTLTTYDSWNNPGFDNANPQASGVTHRQDINTGFGVKDYGAKILDMTSSVASSTYNINIGQAYQDVYLTGPLTVSITNVSAITNTAANTLSALRARVVFYGGFKSNTFSLSPAASINLLWANGPAPTYVLASNVLVLDMDLSVTGGITNCIVTTNLVAKGFSPYIDPSAQNYFAAAGITDNTNIAMWNYFVIALKQASLWESRWDGIWPLSIGTNLTIVGKTNSMSWNLINPGLYRAAFITNGNPWSVNSFTSAGFVSDGTNIYMDTGFNPATAGSPAYRSNSACVFIYNATASPNAPGSFGCFAGAQGSIAPNDVFFCITQDSKSNFGAQGLNMALSEGQLPLTNPFNGPVAYSLTPNAYGFFAPTGISTGSGTGTNVPGVNFFVGARNGGGSFDQPLGARFGLVMIGAGITESQYLVLSNIVQTTMAIGNRQ